MYIRVGSIFEIWLASSRNKVWSLCNLNRSFLSQLNAHASPTNLEKIGLFRIADGPSLRWLLYNSSRLVGDACAFNCDKNGRFRLQRDQTLFCELASQISKIDPTLVFIVGWRAKVAMGMPIAHHY